MGCQAAVHITSRYAQAQYMVIIVTIEMLHVIGTGRRLVIAIRSSLTIFGIINKPQIIKSALVLPEIIVYITCHHHSSLTTGIRIRTRLRTFQSGNSKCILQINRRTRIAAPAITKFIESHHCQVRLQRILLCPGVTSCRPVPGEETLFILVVCQTENIGIVSQQVTAGIINYILGIFCRFRQIIRIAGTGKATLSQIHLSQKTFGTIAVNTSRFTSGRKQLHSFLQSHNDIFVHICCLHFEFGVIITGIQFVRIIMDNGYCAKTTYQIEVSHGFPCQTLAHTLIFHCF